MNTYPAVIMTWEATSPLGSVIFPVYSTELKRRIGNGGQEPHVTKGFGRCSWGKPQ